ncbi:MAG TPA: hypothetical protein VGL53_26150 [Bryobacteraceae bacterium]|jgi:hypothetical protein
MNHRVLFTLIAAATGSLIFAQAPNAATAQQALEKKWQKLRPDGVSERNVLFQQVQAGTPSGRTYPFRVSVTLRDYEPGYPRNRYYGNTCVAKIVDEVYTLEPDPFGGWDAQGKMTPDLRDKVCKPNPAAGVSSIPLQTLPGTSAPGGRMISSASPAGQQQSANGGGAVAEGSYQCWSNGQARMLLNFTIRSAGQYTGSDGRPGRYSFDPATQRISFSGGSLRNAFGPGYHSIYHAPQGRPTVSIRSERTGGEAAFCQLR